MKQLVIFDLDGTLLNTISDLAAACNRALSALGFATHEEAAYLGFVGNGISKLFERALPEAARTPENIEAVRAHFVPYYDAHGADLTRPYAGVEDLLRTLSARGVKLAVLSNKYQRATQALVERFFSEISFCAVLGQRDGVPTKPHPQAVQELLALAQVSAKDALYVGDSEVDAQTARNSGVPCCAVAWGFRTPERLRQEKPDFLVDTPSEILKLI